MTAATPPVRLLDKVSLGMGAIAFGARDTGFGTFLLIFYNQVLGLPAVMAGLALMLTLVADAVLEPLIGAVSDGWRSRLGRRHPFLYAAIVPAALAHAALWLPPQGLDHAALFAWLVGCSIATRFTASLFEVPFTAMAVEFTSDYDERTRLFSWLYAFGWFSGLTLAVMAYAVFLRPTPGDPSGLLAPGGFAGYGLAASGVMLIAMLAAAIGAHRRIPNMVQHGSKTLSLPGIVRDLREIAANPSVVALLASSLLLAASQGFGGAIYNYIQVFFWGLATPQITLIALAPFISAVLVMIFSGRIALGREKRTLAIGLALVAVLGQPLPVALRLLGVFPANGSAWVTPILVFHSAFETLVWMLFSVFSASMLADVVEDHQRRTAGRSEGAIFALRTFVQKAVSGVGVFLTGVVLARVAFPVNASPGEVPQTVLNHLGLTYVLAGAGFGIASALAMLGYRITRAGHAATLRDVEGATAPAE